MYRFLQKLDEFTDFAKQKVSIHTKELGDQNHKLKITSEVIEKSFHHHEQILKRELEKKIDELSTRDRTLLKPSLGILKDYYLDIFRSRTTR